MWISLVSSRSKLKRVERWMIRNISPLETLKRWRNTQSRFPNELRVRRIWRQTMELQQPTQLVSHACKIICAVDSRPIRNYVSWISLVNNMPELSQLMYSIGSRPSIGHMSKGIQRLYKLMIFFIDHSIRWGFHSLDLLSAPVTVFWYGMAQFQQRGFSGPSGKCSLKNPGFLGKTRGIHQARGKSRGFSSCPTNL